MSVTITINGVRTKFYQTDDGIGNEVWECKRGWGDVDGLLAGEPKKEQGAGPRIKSLLWGLNANVLDEEDVKDVSKTLARALYLQENVERTGERSLQWVSGANINTPNHKHGQKGMFLKTLLVYDRMAEYTGASHLVTKDLHFHTPFSERATTSLEHLLVEDYESDVPDEVLIDTLTRTVFQWTSESIDKHEMGTTRASYIYLLARACFNELVRRNSDWYTKASSYEIVKAALICLRYRKFQAHFFLPQELLEFCRWLLRLVTTDSQTALSTFSSSEILIFSYASNNQLLLCQIRCLITQMTDNISERIYLLKKMRTEWNICGEQLEKTKPSLYDEYKNWLSILLQHWLQEVRRLIQHLDRKSTIPELPYDLVMFLSPVSPDIPHKKHKSSSSYYISNLSSAAMVIDAFGWPSCPHNEIISSNQETKIEKIV